MGAWSKSLSSWPLSWTHTPAPSRTVPCPSPMPAVQLYQITLNRPHTYCIALTTWKTGTPGQRYGNAPESWCKMPAEQAFQITLNCLHACCMYLTIWKTGTPGQGHGSATASIRATPSERDARTLYLKPCTSYRARTKSRYGMVWSRYGKIPESIRVMPAVYGYCSAVMSSPRSLHASCTEGYRVSLLNTHLIKCGGKPSPLYSSCIKRHWVNVYLSLVMLWYCQVY